MKSRITLRTYYDITGSGVEENSFHALLAGLDMVIWQKIESLELRLSDTAGLVPLALYCN